MKLFRGVLIIFTILALFMCADVIIRESIYQCFENEEVSHEVVYEEPVQEKVAQLVEIEPVVVDKPEPVRIDKPKKVDTIPQIVDNPVELEVIQEPAYTEEELEILAIIIYQEAGADDCSDDTRRKVGSVFINRVESDLFPSTFKEVATAESQYGTLYWTGIKWPDRAANAGEAEAVRRAYAIAEDLLINGSILPPNVVWQAEFMQGDGLHCEQDGFYFCYSEVSE